MERVKACYLLLVLGLLAAGSASAGSELERDLEATTKRLASVKAELARTRETLEESRSALQWAPEAHLGTGPDCEAFEEVVPDGGWRIAIDRYPAKFSCERHKKKERAKGKDLFLRSKCKDETVLGYCVEFFWLVEGSKVVDDSDKFVHGSVWDQSWLWEKLQARYGESLATLALTFDFDAGQISGSQEARLEECKAERAAHDARFEARKAERDEARAAIGPLMKREAELVQEKQELVREERKQRENLAEVRAAEWERERIRKAAERRRMLIEKYGQHDGERVAAGKIWLGMTKAMAQDSWGDPSGGVNRTVSRTGIREQWVYDQADTILHFEDGVLTAWQD